MSSGSPTSEVQRNGPRPSQNIGRMYSGTNPAKLKASFKPASNACCRILFPYSKTIASLCEKSIIAFTWILILSFALRRYSFGFVFLNFFFFFFFFFFFVFFFLLFFFFCLLRFPPFAQRRAREDAPDGVFVY